MKISIPNNLLKQEMKFESALEGCDPKNSYPFVMVSRTGVVYELNEHERAIVEGRAQEDGVCPRIKAEFGDRDEKGGIGGFCPRDRIPSEIRIGARPVAGDDQAAIVAKLREMTESAGLELIEREDGVHFTSRLSSAKKKHVWWQFWKH